ALQSFYNTPPLVPALFPYPEDLA
ncbi:elongation factor P hydroxylase, partial [Yersinia enterocolitica]|nr:elongation factor P hydroxylase [Yersinia enterocolitica]